MNTIAGIGSGCEVRVAASLLSALLLVVSAGCDAEPALHDDFAVYPASDPVPLSPVPGADVEAWAAAIDGLGLGDWSSSGTVLTGDFRPGFLEPREDDRIEDERRLWSLSATVPNDTVDFDFAARTVTDADGDVLTMYCEAAYEAPPGDHFGDATAVLLEGVSEVLATCVSGFDCDAVGSDELVEWVASSMDTAATEHYADHGDNGFLVEDGVETGGVLRWFSSDHERTAVAMHRDPRSAEGSP